MAGGLPGVGELTRHVISGSEVHLIRRLREFERDNARLEKLLAFLLEQFLL